MLTSEYWSTLQRHRLLVDRQMSTFERLFNNFFTSSNNNNQVVNNSNNSPARNPDLPILKRKSLSSSGSEDTIDNIEPEQVVDQQSSPHRRKRNKHYYQPIELHNNLLSNPLVYFTNKKEQITSLFSLGSVAKVLSGYLPNNPLPLIFDSKNQQDDQQQQQSSPPLSRSNNNTNNNNNPYTTPIKRHHHKRHNRENKKPIFKNTFKPTIIDHNNTNNRNNQHHNHQHQQQFQQQQTRESDRLYYSDSINNYYYKHQEQQQQQQPTLPIPTNTIDQSILNSFKSYQQNTMSVNNNNNNNDGDDDDSQQQPVELNDQMKQSSVYKPKSGQSFVDILKKEQQSKEFKESIDQLVESYTESLTLNEDLFSKSLPPPRQQNYLSTSLNNNQTSLNGSQYKPSPRKSISNLSTLQQQPEQSIDRFNSQIGSSHYNPLSIDDLSSSYSSISKSSHSNSDKNNNGLYKSSNLISSLKPINREIESIGDNELFTSKVIEEKKQTRDEEINQLLSKLQAMSGTSSYKILKQIEERREKEKRMKPTARELNDDEQQLYSKIISTTKRGDDKVVCEFDETIKLTGNDVITLKPGGWLNDEVINYYLELLKKRQVDCPDETLKCHFFNTFFYALMTNNKGGYQYQRVRRWTSKVDIFSLDKVVMPIHLGAHWCLAVVNLKEKRFEYYDSLGGDNYTCLGHLKQWLTDEMVDKKKEGVINLSQFTMHIPKDIPHQLNGFDCGVFTCKFADLSSRGLPLNFTQKDITLFRKLMVVECYYKKLSN
ncbi:sentrin/SUMO-specific protease [Cavenderia fasciculata]|uniref:Sentrin/SUMO-specific protease n=1 Tax=Cavenderia fasciculata TaxID=261658 RepID=F4Q5Y8_CACFS|nr:sentrin/SUMO-specific protease [Cavenderia fasciculata]EGG17397.1 sentrin/SUMO-specific protease [Cavenderia fasciculata]|eukprot:XP_004355881.1 sentrin/SUMO-specific protease [Cavenderia fasciculata]